jgi:hypothetical protein
MKGIKNRFFIPFILSIPVNGFLKKICFICRFSINGGMRVLQNAPQAHFEAPASPHLLRSDKICL